MWTAPVYGDDTGEPCHGVHLRHLVVHAGVAVEPRLRRRPQRQHRDPTGTRPEYNYYAQDGNTTVNGTKYTRGGYLDPHRLRPEPRRTSTPSTAPEQVLFTTTERCLATASETCTSLTSSDQADWPDVPFDQICASGTHCTASQVGPTFFSTRRLTDVTTQYWTGTGTTYQQGRLLGPDPGVPGHRRRHLAAAVAELDHAHRRGRHRGRR